eukprot:2807538-Ditylum_brightwellii.AAC.1
MDAEKEDSEQQQQQQQQQQQPRVLFGYGLSSAFKSTHHCHIKSLAAQEKTAKDDDYEEEFES